MNVRMLNNVCGPGVNYPAGSVQSLSTAAGNDLVNAYKAIPEGPAPSGAIGTLYAGAGYTHVIPAASGYISPSGWIADAPVGGAYYFPDSYTLTVVFPGKKITTFDILRMQPKLT